LRGNGETKQSNNLNWLLVVRLLPPDQVRGRNDIFWLFARSSNLEVLEDGFANSRKEFEIPGIDELSNRDL